MTQPVFGNPVVGPIHPNSWPRPAASHEFKITDGGSFAEHIASGRPAGIDIGNGFCGDPVFAMADGKVSMAGLLGLAKTVRIVHPQYPGYETGATHLATIMVTFGQLVKQGDQIGTHGMTGATACHLHQGCKYNGIEVDWLPFLIQNGAGDMTPIQPSAYTALVNKKTSTNVTANFRAERVLPPDPRAAVLKQFQAGTAFLPVVQADDGSSAGGATPIRWYGGFLYVNVAPTGVKFGWFHSSVVNPLEDNVAAATGFTQVQLDAAVASAINPLNAIITAARPQASAAVVAATTVQNTLG